jgi:hypothetical protein
MCHDFLIIACLGTLEEIIKNVMSNYPQSEKIRLPLEESSINFLSVFTKMCRTETNLDKIRKK